MNRSYKPWPTFLWVVFVWLLIAIVGGRMGMPGLVLAIVIFIAGMLSDSIFLHD
jgi:hypothetical protein